METLILRGESKTNSRMLIKFAKYLNFKVKKLSKEETEDLGLLLSIEEGIQSGFLNEEEKNTFLKSILKD